MYKLNNKTSVSDSYIADYKSIYGSKFSSYSENTKEDVDYIVNNLKQIVKECRK